MGLDGELFAGLVSRIYDAVFMPELWSDLAADVTDAVGGAQVMLGVQDFQAGHLRVVAPRMDPSDLDTYQVHWGASDLLWQRTNGAQIGLILHAEAFVPKDEMIRTGIYNDWHRPMGLGVAGLGVNLATGQGMPAVFGVKRAARRDSFESAELALFTRLAPHMIRATQLQLRLHHLALREELALAGLDRQDEGVILLDSDMAVLHVNSFAREILDARAGLSLNGAKLYTNGPSGSALRRLCLRAAQGTGGGLRIERDPHAPLEIIATPWPRAASGWDPGWLGLRRPAVALIITDALRMARRQQERLCRRYGLTPTEARLALEIAQGHGRVAAAARLGISVGTVRTHLERIFAKTGVHRQAELARLVISGSRGS